MPVAKWGSSQVVNATSAGDQNSASVAALANGGYVVAWVGPGAAGDAVFLQRYDALGNKVGTELNVTALFGPSFVWRDPHLAVMGSGFALTAISRNVAGDNVDHVIDVTFDSSASIIDSFLAAGATATIDPAVAPTTTGYATVYEDTVPNSGDIMLFPGGLGGPGIVANFGLNNAQGRPDVAQLANGWLVVTWLDETTNRVEARVFDSAGIPPPGIPSETGDILVGNSGTAHPKVMALSNGGFVVVWHALVNDNPLYPDFSGRSIHARIFTHTGGAVGDEFIINETVDGNQHFPDLTALPGGRFLATWTDQSTGTDMIRGQLFSSRGVAIGPEFVVDTNSVGASISEVTALSDGRVVVVWTSASGDGSGSSIHSQILDPREGLVNGTAAANTLYGHDVFGDEINGLGGADNLFGLGGNDQIFGGNDGDLLDGGDGNDFLDGGIGGDTLRGGLDNDIYVVDNIADIADESLAGSTGLDQARSSVNFSLVTIGGAAIGKGIIETVTLTGTANVFAYGNSAANNLIGNAGSNVLAGGLGIDTLTGAGGNDFFLFNTTLDGINVDTVTDMNEAGNDTIRLENAIFTALAAGALPAGAFYSSTTNFAHDADDRIIYNSTTGTLYYDANGNAGGFGSVRFAQLDPGLALTAADFTVV